ncbi:hypothetical protein DH2020_015347 [Rehmannia glutinosa]|uniref:R2R3-MYB protein n=1 Tax=Rehmannia glutinosa TaxID=99300 RepID=A0ABR0WW37_REHGL
MGRSPCCDESGLKKGPWTPEEDDKLIKFINKHGHGSWRALPKLAGLNRCGKSCRLRWTNYLRPDIKRGKFTQEEEQTILNLHAVLGNKWSAIATHLPGRTDNEIKNFWNTHLKKKLIQMGFDPMTHRPRTDILSTLPHLIALANLIQNPSWEQEAMRLQNEAVQMAHFNHYLQYMILQPQPAYQNGFVVNPTNINPTLPDMAADFGLVSHLETPSLATSVPFSHLPDLQAPSGANNIETCLSKDSGVINSWMPVTKSSMNITNTGDACSSSSYGGDQMWSQLLDDPLFNEIA